jgi:hypothetical protein
MIAEPPAKSHSDAMASDAMVNEGARFLRSDYL